MTLWGAETFWAPIRFRKKESVMKSTFTIRLFIQGALLGVALASPVMAQMGPGMGAGTGMQGMHGMGRGGTTTTGGP